MGLAEHNEEIFKIGNDRLDASVKTNNLQRQAESRSFCVHLIYLDLEMLLYGVIHYQV